MRFKLPRQLLDDQIKKILYREMKSQGLNLATLPKKYIQDLIKVMTTVEQKGLPSHLVCKKLPHNLGSGIFLHPDSQPLLRGQVISFYAGEVMVLPQNLPDDGGYAFSLVEDMHLTKKEQHDLDKTATYHPRRLYSAKLDAFKKGNFTRFINHSDTPNVEAQMLAIPKNFGKLTSSPCEIIYFVKKRIYPGEQLLVCYEAGGKTYWKPSKIKPFSMTSKTFQLDHNLKVVTKTV
ncbi:MAG: SET domain-containing protein [Chlamydiota bacterium]